MLYNTKLFLLFKYKYRSRGSSFGEKWIEYLCIGMWPFLLIDGVIFSFTLYSVVWVFYPANQVYHITNLLHWFGTLQVIIRKQHLRFEHLRMNNNISFLGIHPNLNPDFYEIRYEIVHQYDHLDSFDQSILSNHNLFRILVFK